MATLTKANEYFVQAQEIAMKDGNEFNELIAIGLQEMAKALDADLAKLQRDLGNVEHKVRGLR
jgi:hypothetical protein